MQSNPWRPNVLSVPNQGDLPISAFTALLKTAEELQTKPVQPAQPEVLESEASLLLHILQQHLELAQRKVYSEV
jgi:hypothetical protein